MPTPRSRTSGRGRTWMTLSSPPKAKEPEARPSPYVEPYIDMHFDAFSARKRKNDIHVGWVLTLVAGVTTWILSASVWLAVGLASLMSAIIVGIWFNVIKQPSKRQTIAAAIGRHRQHRRVFGEQFHTYHLPTESK